MKERLPRGSEIFGSWIIWGCMDWILVFGSECPGAGCLDWSFMGGIYSTKAGLSFAARHTWSVALRASFRVICASRVIRVSCAARVIQGQLRCWCHSWSFALRASFMVIALRASFRWMVLPIDFMVCYLTLFLCHQFI